MRKFLLCTTLLLGVFVFGQQKSTGIVNLTTNVRANFLLDNVTQTVTLTLIGPNDRWFGLQFGSFTNVDGMLAGQDLIWWNNVTVIDSRFNGEGFTPTTDGINNWTLVSNTNNTPSTGLRTLICTRPLTTGDANDYQFNFSDTTIDIAWARCNSASYTLNNHGGVNRGYAVDTPFTNLGLAAFEQNDVQVYPNPSQGNFQISAKQPIQKIVVYSLTGKQLQEITPNAENPYQVQVSNELAKGVYLFNIFGEGLNTWKKVIVE